jgi:hypothetical protein
LGRTGHRGGGHGVTVRPSQRGWRRGVGGGKVAENLSIDGPKSAIARLLGIIVNISASTAPPRPSLITFSDYVRRIEQPSPATLAIAQLTAHGMPQSGRPTNPGGWRWGIGGRLCGAPVRHVRGPAVWTAWPWKDRGGEARSPRCRWGASRQRCTAMLRPVAGPRTPQEPLAVAVRGAPARECPQAS